MILSSAQDLVLYGAGSLREVMVRIAALFLRTHGLKVDTLFDSSGRLRERIEAGARVDLFTSADIGHARKLLENGRASVMAMFARNALGLLEPRDFDATTDTMLETLLAPGVRISVSPPKIDPLGDYTVQLFAAAERLQPGSRATLQARAVVLDSPPGSPPPQSGDTDADAIIQRRVDFCIVYCSGRDRYARILPEARLIPFPAELQVGPEYGLAVMTDAHPAARMLALTILSPTGQNILADSGFLAVALPSA
jgi:molybdate transport system substrate-binding protein